MAHGNGLVVCATESEAREKAQAAALDRWPLREDWTGHDVVVREVSRDTLRDVLGMLSGERKNASGDREGTELLM